MANGEREVDSKRAQATALRSDLPVAERAEYQGVFVAPTHMGSRSEIPIKNK